MRRPAILAIAWLLGLVVASSASAQAPPPLDLPSEPRGEIPFLDEEPVEAELPAPLPMPEVPDVAFELRSVRIAGNTVLDDDVMRPIVLPFIGRRVGQADLETLRAAVQRAYTDRGYATSGALIPDQGLVDGELSIQVVEGRLVEIRITGLERLRAHYVKSRLWPDRSAPLNVDRLGERLSLLQAESDVESVRAELRPGERLGEAILLVQLREGRSFDVALEANNYRSPVIGSYTGLLSGSIRNPIGIGESLRGHLQVSEGLWDTKLEAEVPLWARGPRFGLRFRYSDSEVVERPFDDLDIESDFLSAGVRLSQSVYETLEDSFVVAIQFDWRRSRTHLGGSGFSFSDGVDRGESIVAPLRLDAAWTHRERGRVIALRSLVSFGLPVLDATDVDGAEADSEFVSWVLQGQAAQRFDALFGTELLARADLQLTSSPLLPIEQFSIGGHSATRGFRENQIVRDEGMALSLELRIPVWTRPTGRPILQVAPFFDWSRAFDDESRERRDSESLAAAGLGFRAYPTDWATAVLYWGQRITKADRPRNDKDPQDYGLHFSLTLALP